MDTALDRLSYLMIKMMFASSLPNAVGNIGYNGTGKLFLCITSNVFNTFC
jgi:hypothetical protein